MSDIAKTPKERLGPILEGALHQAAKLHLKAGRASKAINRYMVIEFRIFLKRAKKDCFDVAKYFFKKWPRDVLWPSHTVHTAWISI